MADTRNEIKQKNRRELLKESSRRIAGASSELSKEEMEGVHGGRCVYGTPENGCEPRTPLDPKPPRGLIVLVDQTAAID